MSVCQAIKLRICYISIFALASNEKFMSSKAAWKWGFSHFFLVNEFRGFLNDNLFNNKTCGFP